MKSKLLATFGVAMTVVCGGVDASEMAQDASQEQHDMSPKEIFQYLTKLRHTHPEPNDNLVADIENVVKLIQNNAEQYYELFGIYESCLDDSSSDLLVIKSLLRDLCIAFSRDLCSLVYCNNVLHYNSNLMTEVVAKLKKLSRNYWSVLNRKLFDKESETDTHSQISSSTSKIEGKESRENPSARNTIILPKFTKKERGLGEWDNLAVSGNKILGDFERQYKKLTQKLNKCNQDNFSLEDSKKLKKRLQTMGKELKETAIAANELYQESMDSPNADDLIRNDLGNQYYAFMDLKDRIDELLQHLW